MVGDCMWRTSKVRLGWRLMGPPGCLLELQHLALGQVVIRMKREEKKKTHENVNQKKKNKETQSPPVQELTRTSMERRIKYLYLLT